MYLGSLQDFGLTPNEAKVYQTLIQSGELSAAEISAKGRIHRRNVYDTLDRLVQKGLVFQIFTKGENSYKAVNPVKLLELIKQKEEQLNKVLPELQKDFLNQPFLQNTYIYRGLEGFKNYLRDILELKQDVYFLGSKALWFDEKIQIFLKTFLSQAKQLGINYYHIFDAEIKQQLPHILQEIDPPYKFLPAKYSTPIACDIFGDRVVSFSGLGAGRIDEDITLYILIDPVLAEGYRTWFRFIWDNLPVLGPENQSAAKD